MTSANFTNKFM